eukprot:COSAG02_NODE_7106_length_3182_cov_4.943904_4_plen_178_part_00
MYIEMGQIRGNCGPPDISGFQQLKTTQGNQHTVNSYRERAASPSRSVTRLVVNSHQYYLLSRGCRPRLYWPESPGLPFSNNRHKPAPLPTPLPMLPHRFLLVGRCGPRTPPGHPGFAHEPLGGWRIFSVFFRPPLPHRLCAVVLIPSWEQPKRQVNLLLYQMFSVHKTGTELGIGNQ